MKILSVPFAISLFACACSIQAQNAIKYLVEPDAAAHEYHVQLIVPRVHELTVRVQMPVWMPGAYFVGNFANNVSSVSAKGGSHKSLHVSHPDDNTWEAAANGEEMVQFFYTIKNADIESANGTPRRAHISGPRTYMYVVGRKQEPVDLEFLPPTGASKWPVAISLDPVDAIGLKFHAPTYDVLADAPVEMGDFGDDQFTVAGKPHHVVVYGDYSKTDRAKLKDYCRRIAEAETSFFGGAPFNRYVFQFRCTSAPSRGAGGLEHLGSTEIGTVGVVEDRVRSVIAHEYFHLWNVKRIRPFVLGPFNYVNPPHTANLWWSEGVTSYYGDLLSCRGGLNSADDYLKHLASTITQLQNNPARLSITADEASLRVWEANNSVGFGSLSYYTKGELAGLCLDLKLRKITNGAHSLDDVMKALWSQVSHGNGPGFEEDDIKKILVKLGGMEMAEFYDSVIRSTDELPFEACLGFVGLTLTKDAAPRKSSDAGLRTQFERDGTGLTVTDVTAGGAAEKAGIKVGDRITAINGSSERRALNVAFAAASPGDTVHLKVFSAGISRDVDVVMGSRNIYNYSISVDAAAAQEKNNLRSSWLGK